MIEQPFLDGFLKAEAEARESMITDTARQLHLANEFVRYDKRAKLARNENLRQMFERCKREIIKQMERC